MRDPIFVVDPKTKTTVQVLPTSFYDLNVKERQDLQAWLMNRPEVLGEPLLLITSEFDRFDKSDRRLDLLLLDKEGTLVIAELKLDASGSLADQQAIRYGAFCSTMTMDDVVALLARSSGKGLDEATEAICQFLHSGGLPELTGEPRIILVAGSFNDQELTATVLWLRKFGLNISCVELTPYRYPGDDSNILLVPKILIPLTEARSYQISVERKEKKHQQRSASDSALFEFWKTVREHYLALNPEVPPPASAWQGDWYQITFGSKIAHYEWMVKRRRSVIEVAIHFEVNDRAKNTERMEALLAQCPDLGDGISGGVESGDRGAKATFVQYVVPYDQEIPSDSTAKESARLMSILIERTATVLRDMR